MSITVQSKIASHTACAGLCMLAAELVSTRRPAGAADFRPFIWNIGDQPIPRKEVACFPASAEYYRILDRLTEGCAP